MQRGGVRPNAGRPKGAKSKRTEDLEAATAEKAAALEQILPSGFQGDAHMLLMAVYKDPLHDWHLRIDAAKAAIRYEKPALQSTTVTGSGEDGEHRHKLVIESHIIDVNAPK